MAERRSEIIGTMTARLMAMFFLVALASGQSQAQEILPDLGDALAGDETGGISATIIQLFVVVTLLSLAPGIAMMVTCLPFLVIVFSIMRQAIGVQQAPPNMMIMALAIFLTFFVMEPVISDAWVLGLSPYMEGAIKEAEAWSATVSPFRNFMLGRVEPETIAVLADAVGRPLAAGEEPTFSLLATSFMLSEIKHAFQIGFVIFLPFMIIDLVVASILMAVGMMMVPPTVVSLPFKLGFFVLADGWLRISEAVLTGYA
ncbi:MAG: flagellar type III secretion system pore protein FliP [Pseudomonadota bacterium]